MPATYESIATTTLGSDQASISFSSIPSTYTDLILVSFARRAIDGAGAAGAIQFNGDTGTNYSGTLLQGDGTTAASYRSSNATSIWYVITAADSVYGVSLINIMNYANTSVYKTIIGRKGATGNNETAAGVNLWRSTAAINSITISAANNIKAGSTFSLYGVKSA